MPKKTQTLDELFEAYFNVADELSASDEYATVTTLGDLDNDWVQMARDFKERVPGDMRPHVLRHVNRYGAPPWPPQLAWAEEYYNTTKLGGSLA